MERTTVYLDPADYRRLKALARAQGRSAAQLIREAVAEFTRQGAGERRPRSIAAVRSGRSDLSERGEELLGGLGGQR